jgi:hypothetical protein
MSVRHWPLEVARLAVSTKAFCNATGVALHEPIARHRTRRATGDLALFVGLDVCKTTISADEAHEAIRDVRKARQHLLSFLLRHGLASPYGHRTKAHSRAHAK